MLVHRDAAHESFWAGEARAIASDSQPRIVRNFARLWPSTRPLRVRSRVRVGMWRWGKVPASALQMNPNV